MASSVNIQLLIAVRSRPMSNSRFEQHWVQSIFMELQGKHILYRSTSWCRLLICRVWRICCKYYLGQTSKAGCVTSGDIEHDRRSSQGHCRLCRYILWKLQSVQGPCFPYGRWIIRGIIDPTLHFMIGYLAQFRVDISPYLRRRFMIKMRYWWKMNWRQSISSLYW